MNKKTEEERNCKNCVYYMARYVIKSDGFYDIGGGCINNNLIEPYKNNSRVAVDACIFWESKENGSTDIPF